MSFHFPQLLISFLHLSTLCLLFCYCVDISIHHSHINSPALKVVGLIVGLHAHIAHAISSLMDNSRLLLVFHGGEHKSREIFLSGSDHNVSSPKKDWILPVDIKNVAPFSSWLDISNCGCNDRTRRHKPKHLITLYYKRAKSTKNLFWNIQSITPHPLIPNHLPFCTLLELLQKSKGLEKILPWRRYSETEWNWLYRYIGTLDEDRLTKLCNETCLRATSCGLTHGSQQAYTHVNSDKITPP